MTREEYIKNLKNQGKVTVKDLAELLTFTLDKSNELMFEDDHVEVYIPINFDVDKVLALMSAKPTMGIGSTCTFAGIRTRMPTIPKSKCTCTTATTPLMTMISSWKLL